MKIEKREIAKTLTETKVFYIAPDGEEFESEEQCEQYEKSAGFAYRKRLNKVLKEINSDRAYNILDGIVDDSRHEAQYYSFKPQTEDDIHNFIAYAKIVGGGLTLGSSSYYENHPEVNHFFVRFENLMVGKTYVYFQHCGDWNAIVSRDSFARAADIAFDETLWFPEQEANNV